MYHSSNPQIPSLLPVKLASQRFCNDNCFFGQIQGHNGSMFSFFADFLFSTFKHLSFLIDLVATNAFTDKIFCQYQFYFLFDMRT